MKFKYSDDINIVPGLRGETRECTRRNYLTHVSPKHPDKNEWIEYYMPELLDMYLITKRIIEYKFPGKTDWDRQSVFTNFVTVIYHCSSKV
jgi:hypothetical protein